MLIDALGGKSHRSVPGAVWLKGAGHNDDEEADVDARLGTKLDELTGGDRTRSIVIFCRSAERWLSYNAALRAVRLGYENVHLVPRRDQRLEEGEAAHGDGPEGPMVVIGAVPPLLVRVRLRTDDGLQGSDLGEWALGI